MRPRWASRSLRPGMDNIEFIGTIAAINILGRVARKIADDMPRSCRMRDLICDELSTGTVKSASPMPLRYRQ
ncbi:MAG: hypothetical protein U5N86_13225 [Planctomycetota bacterium]|nr:hypothetical protein [Planctomycetota bacterium]